MVGSGDEVGKTVVWGVERARDLLALEDGSESVDVLVYDV